MIEFVYRENAKETGPERKIELPKNVRQIGDPEDRRKIYIEDYVITYLRRLAGEETLNSSDTAWPFRADGRASLSVHPGSCGPEEAGVHRKRHSLHR